MLILHNKRCPILLYEPVANASRKFLNPDNATHAAWSSSFVLLLFAAFQAFFSVTKFIVLLWFFVITCIALWKQPHRNKFITQTVVNKGQIICVECSAKIDTQHKLTYDQEELIKRLTNESIQKDSCISSLKEKHSRFVEETLCTCKML